MALPGRQSLLRTLILIAAVAAMLATASTAGATPQKRAPQSDASKTQGALCELAGGTSSTSQGFDLEIDGSSGPTVKDTTTCTGGLLDGMNCTNYENFSNCGFSRTENGDDQYPVVDDLAPVEVISQDTQTIPVTDETIVAEDSSPVIDQPVDGTVVDGAPADETAQPVDAEQTNDTPVVDPVSDPVVDIVVAEPVVAEPVDVIGEDSGVAVDWTVTDTLEPIEPIGVD